MSISFVTEREGVLVQDQIEGVEYRLGLPGEPELSAPQPELEFTPPVDATTMFVADRITLPLLGNIFIRERETNDSVATATAGLDTTVPRGDYEIEIASAPMKLYLACTDTAVAVEHSSATSRTELQFETDVEIGLGARSHHEVPAGTITTTSDPVDLMKAVSTFRSALKTTSPERSFPTLRGHPPTLKLGESLHIPDQIEQSVPSTEITIRVPPTLPAVYAVTPLAYYLGAAVKPASDESATLQLHAQDISHPLAADSTYQPATSWTPAGPGSESAPEIAVGANRVLSHVFTLDCAIRTEGLYDVELALRDAVQDRLQTTDSRAGSNSAAARLVENFAQLYEMPIDERTARYLEAPLGSLDGIVEWPFSASLATIPENSRLLPSIAYKLAHVFSPPQSTAPAPEAQASEATIDAVNDFHRQPSPNSGESPSEPGGESTFPGTASGEIVSPPHQPHSGHLWAAPHFPVGTVKPSPVAYERSLSREPSETAIEVQVVCNDARMEVEASDLYGFQEWMSLNIDVSMNLSTAELRELFSDDHDLLHYIGHIGQDGVQCVDGMLDAKTLDATGVEAFLLNGCRSYEQGMALVDAGSLGGIVTTERVGNRAATNTGRTLAGLLDAGFPLYGALDVIRSDLQLGSRYSILGNGLLTLSPIGGTPTLTTVTDVSDGVVRASLFGYPTRRAGLGSMCVPAVGGERMQLACGSLGTFEMAITEFADQLAGARNPVLVNGRLLWSDTTDLAAHLDAIDTSGDASPIPAEDTDSDCSQENQEFRSERCLVIDAE